MRIAFLTIALPAFLFAAGDDIQKVKDMYAASYAASH